MKSSVKIVVGCLSALLISTGITLAEGAAISDCKGSVSVFSKTGPGWRPLAKGATLEDGDNIGTESGASIELVLSSGHRVRLEEQSIAALLPAAKEQVAGFALFKGTVTVDGGKKALTGPLALKTPHLTCAVNKDVLVVSCLGNATKVKVVEGRVELSDSVADTRTDVRAGQSYRSATIEAIDDNDLVIEPVVPFDFTAATCWPPRDGASSLTPLLDGKQAVLKLTLGGNNVQFNSRWIFKDKIDLEKVPYLDLWLRTKTNAPVSILFLVGDDTQTFYQLPLAGVHGNYKIMDSAISTDKSIMDGQWHRVTWNLRDMLRKNLGKDTSTIHSVIIGKWTAPDSVAELELKALTFGIRKTATSE